VTKGLRMADAKFEDDKKSKIFKGVPFDSF